MSSKQQPMFDSREIPDALIKCLTEKISVLYFFVLCSFSTLFVDTNGGLLSDTT